MKNIHARAWLAGMACLALFLMAFTPRVGGYSFTIHLNGKLVSEQFLYGKNEVPTISLQDHDLKGTMGISINECGQIGMGRKLSLRNAEQKILKEWSFADSNKRELMEFALRDLAPFVTSNKVAIYYTSDRVTTPQALTRLNIASVKNKETSR